MAAPVIRAARTADAAAMEAIAGRAYAEALAALEGMPDVAGGMADELSVYRGLISELDGAVAGFVLVSIGTPSAKIVNLATDPACAGQGIARALLDAAADLARRGGATRLELATHAGMIGTQAFYRHLGWRETGRRGRTVGFEKSL